MKAYDFTPEQAYAALEQAVEAAPEGADTVYYAPGGDRCVYVNQRHASCLVGHALGELGVPLRRVKKLDNWVGKGRPLVARRLADAKIGNYDANAVLSAAQSLQDQKKTWGEALRRAKVVLDQQNRVRSA